MTTQEIHQALNARAHQQIPHKHLQILMERFTECTGQEINEENNNLEAFLQYAW